MATAEDEFENRDAQGLTPRKKDGPGDDAAAAAKAQSNYMRMTFVMVPAIQLVLATGTFFVLRTLGYAAMLDSKFAFLSKFDLGYVYLAVWILFLGRTRILVNANAARAGARVERPCQHVYKVMDPNAPADAPFVLMATTGWPGRFNRAQRGAFNTDESLPQMLMSTVLAGAVFGPAVVVVALLAVYGRVKFALKYTESTNMRGAGLIPAMLGEGWMSGLVLFVAIKAIAGSLFLLGESVGELPAGTEEVVAEALAAAPAGA